MADPVIVIGGPTASGKSAAALAIAQKFGGVVINADSMQIYRGLEVLTAAPDLDTRKIVPHRLYGVLDPSDPCSAGKWREMALAEINAAHQDGKLPIVVGGTGLYLRSLISGIDRMPDVPAAIRASIRDRMKEKGAVTLHRELSAKDPEMAARLDPGDSQRIARALEILDATGKSLLFWQKGVFAEASSSPYKFHTMIFLPLREQLYRDCDGRFDWIVANGGLEEVRTLEKRGLDPELPAMKALGIPDLIAHIRGNTSLESAVAQGQQATRRYAKRQISWFRNQIIADEFYKTKYNNSLDDKIFSEISNFLLTSS